MPEARLQRTRATLPEGYQFPTNRTLGISIRMLREYDIEANIQNYQMPVPPPKVESKPK